MRRLLYLGVIFAITTILTAQTATASLSGAPPPQPDIANGCRVTVYYSNVPFAATSGSTSLSENECRDLNVRYNGESNLGIKFGGFGADPIAALMTPTTTYDYFGNFLSSYRGVSLRSAQEIVAISKNVPIPPESQLSTSQHFLLTAGHSAQGTWYGGSSGTSTAAPVMCGPLTVGFSYCTYQTKGSVAAGTVQTAQNAQTGYTGSVTAVCNSSGQYEYSNFSCSANPPPPPPPTPTPAPVYDWSWNWWGFYW